MAIWAIGQLGMVSVLDRLWTMRPEFRARDLGRLGIVATDGRPKKWVLATPTSTYHRLWGGLPYGRPLLGAVRTRFAEGATIAIKILRSAKEHGCAIVAAKSTLKRRRPKRSPVLGEDYLCPIS